MHGDWERQRVQKRSPQGEAAEVLCAGRAGGYPGAAPRWGRVPARRKG